MPKKFMGTDLYRLPAKLVEPYRLWFEFLQLASRDTNFNVNRTFYEPWGPYEMLPFDDWWKDHWERLFAVDIRVREIVPGEAMEAEPADHALLVRIPLSLDPKRSLAEVVSLLKARGASERLVGMRRGRFYLDCGTKPDGTPIAPATRFLKNLDKVRFYLNFYRHWVSTEELDERRRVEKAVLSYKEWGDRWNATVKAKGWKRTKVEVPIHFTNYRKYLVAREGKKRLSLHDGHDDHTHVRRQVMRDLAKAKKIVANVALGVFPGRYE